MQWFLGIRGRALLVYDSDSDSDSDMDLGVDTT